MLKKLIDPKTKKRIHEHLSNQRDIISDEDIRNATTAVFNPEEPVLIPGIDLDNDNRFSKGQSVKDNADPAIQTTWNVLES